MRITRRKTGLQCTAKLYPLAARLAESTSVKIGAVLVGTGAGDGAKEAIACGADQAFTIENPILDELSD